MHSKIKINDQICAIITIPDALENEKLPAVLMFHGFGTDKDEVAGTFKYLSEKLSEANIVSLRIDFSGYGESHGNTEDCTIDRLLIDAEIAYNYLITQSFVDLNRLGICGFSLGAGISILLSHDKENIFKSMALISPAGDLTDDFTIYFSQQVFEMIATSTTSIEVDLGWRTVKLKDKFIESLKKYILKNYISNFKGAFFAIAGSEDFSKKHVEDYFRLCTSSEKVAEILKDEDHIFHGLDHNLTQIPEVIDKTMKWFKRTLEASS